MFVLLALPFGLVFQGEAATVSPAQELLGSVPENTFISVATSGTDSLEAAFKQSSLGRIWNDPGVQQFVEQIKEPLLSAIKAEAGEDFPKGDIEKLVRLFASCPIAAGAAETTDAQGEPSLYGFVIVKAGDKKETLSSLIHDFESQAGADEIVSKQIAQVSMRGPRQQDDVPIYWGWHQDTFVVLVNDEKGLTFRNLASPSSRLTSSPQIPAVLENHGDAIVVTCDFQKLGRILGTQIAKESSPEEAAKMKSVFNALGLSSIRSFSMRMGFAGPNVVADGLLATSGPPAGILSIARQIDVSAFDKVQAGAVSTMAFNIDVAGLYDMVLGIIESEIGSQGTQTVHSQIAAVEQKVGVKIRDGLIKSLAGPMIVYNVSAFQIPQVPNGGWVLVAELNEPALFENNLQALGAFAASQAEGMLQITSQKTADGLTLHNWVVAPLAMAQVMPCWTISKKQLVFATHPYLVERGVKQINSANPTASSIRSQKDFRAMEGTLPAGLLLLRYDDSETQLRNLHVQMQQLWPMLTMGAANSGVKLPVMLPNIEHLIQDMPASWNYTWLDANGIREHYQGCGLQNSNMGVGGAAMGLAILMPALNKTKQIARRTVSATNLKGLGNACMVHAFDHDDEFPPTLKTLVDTADVSPKSLESPRKPEGFDGPSYIYIAGQDGSAPAQNILAYENPAFAGDKINVLYVDGHVAAIDPDELDEQLAQTRKRMKGADSSSKTDTPDK